MSLEEPPTWEGAGETRGDEAFPSFEEAFEGFDMTRRQGSAVDLKGAHWWWGDTDCAYYSSSSLHRAIVYEERTRLYPKGASWGKK